MSHNRNHIIIQFLIDSDQFAPADKAKLTAIAEKMEGEEVRPCTAKDAEIVSRIVKKTLRAPAD